MTELYIQVYARITVEQFETISTDLNWCYLVQT